MGDGYIKKNGLLYSADGKTVIGVDDTSHEFTGRIPYGAHFIDDEVFCECPYESITLPDSLKKLGFALFRDSLALEKVKLPMFIKELPNYLFAGCSALNSIKMPNELDGFSEGLFMGCESLQEIPFRTGIKELPKLVFADCASIKSLVIPPTVERIEDEAAKNCINLESVVFPSSIKYISSTAFEGCTSLHNIRIDGDNSLFYVNESDGSLYERSSNGDKLIVKSYKVSETTVSYFEENVDDIPIEDIEDEEELNDDSLFSAEIGAADEESDLFENTTNDIMQGDKMSEQSDIDSMLADIMGEEKERTNAVAEDVGVSDKESEVLSETISVMEDSAPTNDVAVSQDELERLFSKNEEQEIAAQVSNEDPDGLDSKTKILLDSVSLNKILTFDPKTDDRSDGDLFVIAEKVVKDENGNDSFSSHLVACCNKMATIHDFRRVILLYGLPVDNDEFMQFYRHFIGKRNLILACEAERPSLLSDYCKTVCENSRISLDKKELAEQRKYASVKTETLVKLVIRDNYSND